MKTRGLFLSIFLSAFMVQLVSAQATVRFYLNMKGQIDQGNFTVGVDTVDLAGSFNGWHINPDTLVHMGNGIYAVNVNAGINVGDTIQYKFRINSSWATSEFPDSMPARKYVVQTTNDSIYHFYNDYIINSSLILYLPFDGSTDDASGNDYNAIYSDVILAQNRFGRSNSSYYFDGINSYLDYGGGHNFINQADSFTISVWIYPDNLHSGQNTILAERVYSGHNYQLAVTDGALYFSKWSEGSETPYAGTPGTFSSDKWYHVVLTRDMDSLIMYVNGQRNASFMIWSFFDTNPSEFMIGTWDGSSSMFQGRIDDIRFYDKALSDSEVHTLFAQRELNRDLSVIGIIPVSPLNQCTYSSNESVLLKILNNGLLEATSYDLSYSTDGGASFTTTPVAIPIAGGDTLEYYINNLDFSSYGTYGLVAATELIGDEYTGNDTLVGPTITCKPVISSFPHLENFEGGPNYWTVKGNNPSWALGTPAGDVIIGAASGVNAWKTGLSTPHNLDEQSWVESPCFNFTGLVNPVIEFKMWYYVDWVGAATIQYSTDGGLTWSHIGNQGDYLNWYNMMNPTLMFAGGAEPFGWMGYGEGWTTARHKLDGLGGMPNVRFRIAFGSQQSGIALDGFAFDDIKIFEQPQYDLGINAITGPSTSCDLFSSEPSVNVTNYGADTLYNVWYWVQVNSDTPDSAIVPSELLPGQTADYTLFSIMLDLSADSTYLLKAWISVPGDINQENDTAWRVVVNKPFDTLPYFEDFEDGPGAWTIAEYPDGQNQSWEWGVPAGTVINDPGNHAWVTNLDGEYNFSESGYIESPCLNLGGGTAILEFRIWRDLPADSSGHVFVETWDSENGWITLGAMYDYLNWYNSAGNWTAVADTGWVTVRHSVPVVVQKIRIYFTSTENWWHGEGVAIDDIKIIETPSYDMRMVQWLSPQSGPAMTSHEQVTVQIINDGRYEPGSVEVSYSINGGASWRTDTVSGMLYQGMVRNHTFGFPDDTADFSALGDYTCIAKVKYLYDTVFTDNDSIVVTITNSPMISNFPYIQDFEGGAGDWTSGGQNSSWAMGTPAAPNINRASSGVNAWVTNLTGNHNPNERSWVESPYFNLSAVQYPYIKLDKWSSIHWNEGTAFQFSADSGKTWIHVGDTGTGLNWYNNYIDALYFLGNNAGWSEFDAGWLTAGHDLSSIPRSGPLKFRFIFGTFNPSDTEGFGFDNIRIYDRARDITVTEFIAPLTSCGLTATDTVIIKIKNRGMLTWFDSLKVAYQINMGPVIQEKITSFSFPTDSSYVFKFNTSADLSVPGTYQFRVWSNAENDGWRFDDTLSATVISRATVSTFPYTEDFEGAPLWVAGGHNPSWQLGAPAGPVIDHAASGTKVWVTNLTGPYNQDEQSWVAGPCFNFSGLTNPVFKMKIWNHTNNQAGAAIQYSVDGGDSWNTIGGQGQRINWYDDNLGAIMAPLGSGDCWTGLRYDWLTASYDLGFLGGEPQVMLRVIFATDPGANNVYDGFAFDDMEIYEKPAQDGFMVHINSPSTGCGVAPYLGFEMVNAGTSPLDSVTIGYQINAETPGSYTFYSTVNPDQSFTNGFNIPDYFTAPGEYIIKAWTSMQGDLTNWNDTLYKEVVVQPLISANPYIEDFESDTSYWDAVAAGYVGHEKLYPGGYDMPAGWTRGTPAGSVINSAASGTKAWFTGTGGAPFYDNSYAVSPCIDLSAFTRPGIQFKMWRQLATPAMKVTMEYSTDQGSTWNLLGNTGDTLNWFTSSNQWMDTLDAGWITARHMLDGLAGQPNVRFKFYSEMIANYDQLDGFAFDDFMIYEVTASQDAAAGNIVAPGQKCEFLPGDTVKLEIHNAGTAPVTNVGVHYRLNAMAPVNEIFTGTLAPDETQTYTFSTPVDLTAYQEHQLTAWVTLAGDPFQDNDTVQAIYYSKPLISSFPYYQDFEGGNDYWHSYGYANSWALGTPSGSVINSAASGSNAWVTNLTGPYNNNEFSHVESPCFDFSGLINPVFEMDIWTDCEDLDDGAALQYSLDNGNTWMTLGTQGTSWYNYTSPPYAGGMAAHGIFSYWTNQSWGWWHVNRGMHGLAGQAAVKFRITFANDAIHNTEGIAFDNVQIYDKAAVVHYDTAGTGIIIDGVAGEQLWLDATQNLIQNLTGTVDSTTDLSGYWSATWDSANIYFLVDVTDSHLFNFGPGSDHNMSDGVELLFDLLNNKDGQGAGNFDNRSYNFVWNLAEFSGNNPSGEGIEFTNSTSGTGYVFEIKIPWTTLLRDFSGPNEYLHISPATGTELGIDVRLKDNDNDSEVEGSLNWAWAVNSNLNGAATMLLDGRPPFGYDLEVLEIQAPGDLLCQPSMETVTIRFINRGASPFTDPELSYSADNTNWVNEVWSGTINPGDTFTYVFTSQVNLYSDPYYRDIKLFARISDPQDENLFNNLKYKNIPLYGNHTPPVGWNTYSVCDVGVYPNTPVVLSLAEDQSGNIWASFDRGGLAMFNGSVWTVYNTFNSGITADDISSGSIVCSGPDSIWIGHWSHGISIFNGSVWTNLNPGNSPLPCNNINGILKASDGTFWFATSCALVNYDGSASWTIYNTGNSSLPGDYILALAEDQSGHIWIGTSSGLAEFDGVNFIDHSSSLSNTNVWDVMVDAADNIWVGTENGLNYYDRDTWQLYTSGNSGLPGNQVWSLFQDSNGNYWFGGNQFNGVTRYNGTDWWIYNTDNGMTGNIPWMANMIHDASGKIWFPTTLGITVKESYPIEIYRINTTDIYCQGGNDGSIQILAVSNDALEYSIDGGSSWQVGNLFTGLMPGDYTLSVASTLDTIWPATVTITEFPNISGFPYYQDFESGDGNWKAGGENSSWALGVPSGGIINHAASGSNAWVTNLAGAPNNLELSWIESPCFDLSAFSLPLIGMHLYTDMPDPDDGAALQYSIDGGSTWVTVGSAGDPNWYNQTADTTSKGLAREGIFEYWTGQSFSWVPYSHVIPEIAGQPAVRFRFIFGTDSTDVSEGIGVDGFSILDDAVGIPWDVSGINVDGIADEILWLNAPQISLPGQGIGGPSDFSAKWRAAWDADNLYLLVEVTDDTLYNADGPGAASNDNIEVYLNLYNNKDGRGYTAADNWGFRFIWNLPAVEIEQLPGIEFMNSSDTTGYTYEIKLPWAGLLQDGNIDIPLATGTLIGFDVRITDNDGSGLFPRFNWKSAVRTNFNNAGNIMLNGRPPINADVRVASFESPVVGQLYCQPAPQSVIIRIVNTGLQPAVSFDVGYMIDGTEMAVETITDTVYPGDTLSYTFASAADLYVPGYMQQFSIRAYTLLPGDEVPQNDGKEISLKVYGDNTPVPGWTLFGPCDWNNEAFQVTGVTEDLAGNIWIGTGGGGVIMYDGITFTTYDTINSEIGGVNVESMYTDSLGNILVGDWYNGLSIFNGSSWTTYNTSNSDISGNWVEGLLYYNGLYYIGTDGGGLDVFDGSTFTAHYNTGNSGIISDQVQDLVVDSSGNIWIAAITGISIFDGTSFTNYTRDTLGTPTALIYRLLVDDENNIWISTWRGGVIKFTGTTWENYTPLNSGLRNNNVLSLGKDKNGRIWFGGFGSGYDVFDGTNWVNYSTENVLSNDYSWQDVLTASDGRLWLPTYDGLDRYNIEYFDPIPIPYDLTGITVDGIADEALWTSAPVVTMAATGPDGPTDLSMRWRAAWDADNLYVLVEVTDDTLFNAIDPASANGYQNDNVEIYLDMLNNKNGLGYQQPEKWRLRYIWNLPLEHGEKVPGVEFTNTSSDSGYVFEFKFPWLSLLQSGNIDIPLATGTQIGFDVKITDNDGAGTFKRYTWRNATAGNFNGAGAILLDGRPPITIDAKVVSLLEPFFAEKYCQPSPQNVTIRIVNAGEQPISNFNVGFMVDSIEQAVETITDSIWPGDTLNYTFATQADINIPGFYRDTKVKAYTLLAGDEVSQNNSKAMNLNVYGENIGTPGWTLYGPCDYNSGQTTTGVSMDDSGNYWIGTQNGVVKFDGTTFTSYDTVNSDLAGPEIEVMGRDDAGNILFGTWYNGLSIYNGTTWTNYDTGNSELSNNMVEALLYFNSLYYIGTDGGGLDVFDGSSFIAHYNTGNSGIISDMIYDLDADTAGNIWIAALSGISVFNGTDFTNYPAAILGAGANSIYRVFITDSNQVWIGTYGNGIFRLDDTVWTSFNTANSGLSNNRVFSIGRDNAGNMWFYTFGGGLDKFDGTTWTNYSYPGVMPSNNSWQDPLMASDGRIWFPTYNGFAIHDPSILDQVIDLSEGWNIFSTYLLPLDPSMQAVMQPLIDADLLVKVQDEAGASVDSVPGIGWVNSIGNLVFSEGYKIKVKGNTQLSITGTLVPLPATINLTSGWNIISYPETAPENTSTILDSLLTEGQLDKVQDETGSAFENVPPLGWIDNIGQFLPGEGYKMKVNANTAIIIHESTLKAGVVLPPSALAPEFFISAYTGYGLDHMNLYIIDPSINGMLMAPGDEIAVYDGKICVGAARIGNEYNGYISLKASSDDPTTKSNDGFTAGNRITFRVWDASEQLMTDKMEVTYYEGYTDRFQGTATTLLGLNALITGNDDLTGLVTGLGDNYPNPFSHETTIDFSVEQAMKVTLSVYDLLGRKVRILIDEPVPAGNHRVLWNGQDDLGQQVTPGMYFYEMKAGAYRSVKRMNLIY